MIASRDAEFRAKQGNYVADRLPPFITSVRRLLNESRVRPGWDADTRGSTLVILADALQTLGDQSGQSAPLQEAVDAYRAALREWTRERVPLDWATTQNNLGTALSRLGDQSGQSAPLQEPGRRLSRGAAGADPRAGAAAVGDDAEQPRHRAYEAG